MIAIPPGGSVAHRLLRGDLGDPRRLHDMPVPFGPALYVVTAQQVRDLVATDGVASFLSDRELDTLGGLGLEQRRWDWLAGRLAAKVLLERTLAAAGSAPVALRQIEVGYDADGAPCFTVADRPGVARGWSISISHDDGDAVCAVCHAPTAGRVGVDLERDRPLQPELLRYFLSIDERRRIGTSGDTRSRPPVTPVALWAIKEAVIKAAPRRTGGSMWNVGLTWNDEGLMSVSLPGSGGETVTAGFERRGDQLIAFATCRAGRED